MIPELGQFALVMALAVAIIQTVFPLLGAHLKHRGWMAVAAPAAQAQFGFFDGRIRLFGSGVSERRFLGRLCHAQLQ